MATIDRGTIYVARQSFNVWDGGRLVTFRRGRTTIRAGHPLLEGREDRFAPFEVTYDVAPAPAPAAARRAPARQPVEPETDDAAQESESTDDEG